MKIQNFFKKLHRKDVYFLMVVLSSSLLIFATVNAAPPTTQYSPGETLDPSCSPGDSNCNVDPGRIPYITATTTATSTFAGGISSNAFIDAGYFIASSTSASSTFANGINLTDGCFAIDGTCLSTSGGGGSGTVNTGTAGYLAYYPGTGTTVDDTSALFWDNTNARLGIGTTSPYAKLSVAGDVVASHFIATTTATSTFAGGLSSSGLLAGSYFFGSSSATSTFTGGIQTALLNVTSSATSSFTNGINLSSGCFSVNGTCISGAGGSGSGTVNTGTAGYLAYYPSSDTTVDDAGALFWDNTNSRLGIGTSSPYAALSVVGEAVFRNFTATSTTATSTIAGGLNVGSGGLVYDYSTGETTISSLNLGAISFATDAGQVTWIDMPVTSDSTAGSVNSYSALIDGTAVMTIYSEADGSGSISNTRVGIGTSTPYRTLSVAGDAVIDSFLTTSYIVSTSTATSTFAGGVGSSSLIAGSYFYGSGSGTSTLTGGLSSSGLLAGSYFFGSSSATSTFTGGIQTALLNVTSSATSSFTNGINLSSGCFSVNGTCISGAGGSGSGTVNTGTAGYLAYYPSSDTTVDDAGALFWDNTNSRLGIGTSSPYAALSVVGEAVFRNFTATSTTATSTIAGGLNVGSGGLVYDYSSGVTSVTSLEIGATNFASDVGTVSWVDVPVTSASGAGVVNSYSASVDGNPILTVYSTSDGSGGISASRIGIGTTSPYAKLSVAGDVVASHFIATTTATSTFAGGLSSSGLLAGSYFFGSSSATSTFTGGIQTALLNVTSSATSSFTNGINLSSGCFSVNGTCISGAGGSGSGTVNTGTAGYLAYYPSSDTTVDDAGALFWDNTNSRLGIGTSSPYAALSVVGEAVFRNFTATSTTATSTVAGGLNVGSGSLVYDFSTGITSVNSLEVGNMSFDSDAGIVTWMDMPVSSTASAGTIESYTANIDGNPILTIFATADGSGGTSGRAVGIGTTTPVSTLSVQGSLCVRDTGSCGTTAGTIYATTASISDIDLAENYIVTDDTIDAGELVSLQTNASSTVKRASQNDRGNLLGIISTAPGLLLGQEIQNSKPVALAGRVPAKINNEGGSIQVGDRVTISSVSGVATKATTTGRTVGIALEDFSGTEGIIEVFVKLEDYIPGSQLAFDDLGNLGIGTTSPEYKLHVMGDIAATSFVNISTRTAKKNISYLAESDYTEYLGKIKNMNPAKYQYNIESDDSPAHIGLIAEESPDEILTANGKGVDIYKFTTLLLGGIKAQQSQIDDLISRVNSLESGTSGANGLTLNGVWSGLESFGVKLSAGLLEAKEIVTARLTVGSRSNPAGITLYDEVTGEPYCLKVRSGVTISESGECPRASVNTEANSSQSGSSENTNTENTGTNTTGDEAQNTTEENSGNTESSPNTDSTENNSNITPSQEENNNTTEDSQDSTSEQTVVEQNTPEPEQPQAVVEAPVENQTAPDPAPAESPASQETTTQ